MSNNENDNDRYTPDQFGTTDKLSSKVEGVPFGIQTPKQQLMQRTFTKFDEAIAVANKQCPASSYFGNRTSRHKDGVGSFDRGWFGTPTFKDAYNLAYNGWKEGLEIIHGNFQQYREVFKDLLPNQDVRKDTVFDTHGEDVDVVRAIEGIPENMSSYKDTEEMVKVVSGNKLQRIVVQCCFNSGIAPETIALNGSLVTILVEQYELHGFRTELICRFSNTYNDIINYDIVIKRFDESPDFNKIAFVMAHPSMLRRLLFAIWEDEPVDVKQAFNISEVGGYGSAGDYKDDTLTDKNTLYVPNIANNMGIKQFVQYYRNLVANHFSILDFKLELPE